MELDRTANINNVDAGIKNKWNWKWTEEKDCHGVKCSCKVYNLEEKKCNCFRLSLCGKF